ncbi:MAG: hypothetical protein L0228_05915 [Planctomycetes bacterium]|nr:hypothetical protein [Planctomycetota bacterium]
MAAITIGCVAMVLAVSSWIRREGIVLGVFAAFLGAAAIAWEQALILFALFVFAGGPAVCADWPRRERRKSTKAA